MTQARASQARIYDYWLGGKDNFAVDRAAAEQAIAAYPPILRAVRVQRAFLATREACNRAPCTSGGRSYGAAGRLSMSTSARRLVQTRGTA